MRGKKAKNDEAPIFDAIIYMPLKRAALLLQLTWINRFELNSKTIGNAVQWRYGPLHRRPDDVRVNWFWQDSFECDTTIH